MANLDMPTISVKIEADGSTAIQEIKDTAKATDELTEATEKLSAADAGYHKNASGRWVDARGRFVSVSEVAQNAGTSVKELGENTEKAGNKFNGLGEKAQKSTQQINKSLKEAAAAAEKLGGQMTKFTTVPIVTALTAAVKAAGDFTETLGKTEVVFGDLSDSVLEWSENAIDAMGMAQSTALELASTYGDMATGMGLSANASATMSMNLTQLAADIASFKNKSVSDVNTALMGIFTGETESLKQLGIVMTQANLQQYAYTQGITENVSALSQAEQVQLRYSYVMAQTSNAQGDFARTSENLNNQARKLTETLKEIASSYGSLLTERVAGVVGGLQSAAQWVAELDDGAKENILTIGMIVAATGPLLLVGGKVLTLIATLKTQVLALAANPVVLGVMGTIAALSALVAIAKNTGEGLDETSETYKNLKNAIEGGASGTITIDDSQVTALNESPPTITINADGQNALDEAQAIADKLNGDEYDGTLTIDGDPEKAETALQELEDAINAAKASMTIDADGNAVIGSGGEVERLQKAIAEVKGIVVITTDPVKKAELESYLTDLEKQLAGLGITASFTEDAEAAANIQAFKDKLEELPKGETYTATGEFKISEATSDTIQEYAEAVAAAATATGDYADAVENLNNIVDQETARKVAEVNQQIAEYARDQAAYLNAGYITQEQYDANVAQALSQGEEKIRQIEAEAEAQQKLNQVYADGMKNNDYSAAASAFSQIYADQQVSQEQVNESGRRLVEASEAGTIGDAQSQIDAQITLNALKKEAVADQEALADATEKYDSAIATANANEEAAAAIAQEKADRAQLMLDALQIYADWQSEGKGPQEAMDLALQTYADEFTKYEGLKDDLAKVLQGEDGEGLDYADTLAAMADVTAAQEQAQQQLTTATEEATAAREAAFQEFMATLASIQEGYTTSEAAGALALVEQAGIAVSELDKTMITTGTQAIADLANTLTEGTDDISGAMATALNAVGTSAEPIARSEGEDVGKNAISGVASGITKGTPTATAAARASARAVTAAYKSEFKIFSPSHVMRDEVGLNVIAGVGAGIEKGLPPILQAVKRSAESIVSSATGVVNNGAYTVPLEPAAAANVLSIDYDRLAEAVTNRPISFSVGAEQLAVSTRDAAARQQALRVQQVNAGYGGKGA